ncbi:phosphomethylpyrimidine synthase [candidate division WOR-3 bacterium]|uniref:Phosphomethylpyrimidine synthase n=1 Tax=candidate division WOR-3 bacterium TaxID=2052148 RepID=A0A660SKL4_UNCW3|nr:MAG: phosphomethylpyrimidine synthase [candidate division WOR-3 bacterium]
MKLIERVARMEGVRPRFLKQGIAEGTIILVRNRRRRITPLAIGRGLRTKVNANIGTSPDRASLKYELKKLKAALEAGTDAVMDLSTGGDIDRIRREIIAHAPVPVGTVPIYQAAIYARKKKKSFVELSPQEIMEVIERHLEDGVDFITVHCGITRRAIEVIKRFPRLAGVVSRGGSMILEWMSYNDEENPLYEYYDELLKLAKRYDATLSLGDGLRPGAIHDGTDPAQLEELMVIGELVKRAREAEVKVMVEGPGHLPLNQIEANIKLEKKICGGAPFYVLGPLVTDISTGYDHISAAIGGALAAYYGADFLCYVTPTEHLSLPKPSDVKLGVIAARIAGHAADIAKGIGSEEWDFELSRARAELDWRGVIRLSIDPERTRKFFHPSAAAKACTMCGEFCAVKKSSEIFEGRKRRGKALKRSGTGR